MKHRKPPIPVIVLLVAAVIVGGYYSIRSLTGSGSQTLSVSGTIEAGEVNISPEIAGKVAEVFVEEGANVKAGDPLFRMDDSQLLSQRAVAATVLETAKAGAATSEAALDTARANQTLTLNLARMDATAGRTLDWRDSSFPGYSLPGGYFSQQDLISAAETEVGAARSLRDGLLESLKTRLGEPGNAEFASAEARLLAARVAATSAQNVLSTATLSNNNDLMDKAQAAFDTTKAEMESAQGAYDLFKEGESEKEIILTRLELAIAQERYESAQDRLVMLQTGEASPKLDVANASVHQAEMAVEQAVAAIQQAEAQLALQDLQISKLTILAPCDGTILTLSIAAGEMVSPAAGAIKLGKLFDLSITVYVPEDIYGTLSLGQMATLTVDSYPLETFSASITQIADQAEFTPRNVQTAEGRKATVFAVTLKLQDMTGKLKPGMPADLVFDK
jgi:HlyD family secretion protein